MVQWDSSTTSHHYPTPPEEQDYQCPTGVAEHTDATVKCKNIYIPPPPFVCLLLSHAEFLGAIIRLAVQDSWEQFPSTISQKPISFPTTKFYCQSALVHRVTLAQCICTDLCIGTKFCWIVIFIYYIGLV